MRTVLLLAVLLCHAGLSRCFLFEDLFSSPKAANSSSISLTGADFERLHLRSCYDCHGTTISAVTSSCWQTVDEDHTRFVSVKTCLGSCSITVLNHTTIGLVEYTRRCEPSCNASCYLTDKQTNLCKYCCYGDKCNDVLPTYKVNLYDTADHVSVPNLRKWITGVLAKPRHHAEGPSNKVATRKLMKKLLLEFGLPSEEETFSVWQIQREDRAPINFQSYIKTVVRGYNIIATIRGENYGTLNDKIIVVMAHYDTHSSGTPGVDDNGSGVSALLEVARLLTRDDYCTRSHSVVLVGTDFKEEGHFEDGLSGSGYTNCYIGEQFNGLAGSAHFLCGWLLPHLRRTGSQLMFAVNLHSLLNYDTSPASQLLPNYRGLVSSRELARNRDLRSFEAKISRRRFAGDWLHASHVENSRDTQPLSQITQQLSDMWERVDTLDAGFIAQRISVRDKILAPHDDCLPFMQLRNPLPCISLSDTGELRGSMRRCHEKPCDDKRRVTTQNLKFLSQVVDTVWRVIENASESGCIPTFNTTTTESTGNEPSSASSCDQALLQRAASSPRGSGNLTVAATCRFRNRNLELCDPPRSLVWGVVNSGTAWIPKRANKASSRLLWFKVDLGSQFNITGVAVQGVRGRGYVKSFMLSYSEDGTRWQWHIPSIPDYRKNSKITELRGNRNPKALVSRQLAPSIAARFLRFHPRSWKRQIALRAEIYGCRIAQ